MSLQGTKIANCPEKYYSLSEIVKVLKVVLQLAGKKLFRRFKRWNRTKRLYLTSTIITFLYYEQIIAIFLLQISRILKWMFKVTLPPSIIHREKNLSNKTPANFDILQPLSFALNKSLQHIPSFTNSRTSENINFPFFKTRGYSLPASALKNSPKRI